MTKEDNEDGYDDAFLNEVIEKDEIDRLFDKKVFVNVKRFGDNLIAQVDNGIVSFDKEKDNLIIKGNNLLALHALKNEFAGKGYGDFKMAVGEAVADALAPIQAEKARLLADKAYLNGVMKQGAESAFRIARKTLSKVYRKVGFYSGD